MDKEQNAHPSKAILIVRLRGDIKTHPDVRMTFDLLNLTRVNHCVVIPKNVNYLGMMQVIKDFATWGEADAKTLARVITERGRLTGDRPITDAHVKATTTFATINDFAAAIIQGKAKYKDLKEVKPLFRLHPPMGGIVSVKRSHKIGGDLGYRGEAINALVERMVGIPTPRPKHVKDLKKWIHKPATVAPAHHEHKAPKPEAPKEMTEPKAEHKAPKAEEPKEKKVPKAKVVKKAAHPKGEKDEKKSKK
jgi:large subunit ribosomal protein L30